MATWKKLVVSGSNVSQLNNDANYLVSGDSGIELSGSFSGSFFGDGSGLTGVVATNANALTDGNGINDFSYDGSSAGVTVSVQADGSTLTVGAGGVKVADAGITATQLATSVAGDGLAGGAGTALSVNVDDSSIEINSDTLRVKALGITNDMLAGSIANAKLANSTISGKALGTDLDDLTVDDSTIELNTGTTYNGSAARTISVKAGGITTTEIADSLGTIGSNSFTGSFSGSFTGDVDIDLAELTQGTGITTFSYDGNSAQTVSIKNADNLTSNVISKWDDGNGQFTDSSLTDNGTNITGTTSIRLSGTNSSLTGSFTGSFFGDGSGLTGVATDLTIDADSGGTSTVDLLTQTLDIAGGTNINTSVSGQTITVNLDSNISVTDATVSGDLVVLGTASFQNTTNLEVADRFVLLASGSNATGDGGIVIQQATQDVGELFGWDDGTDRWAVDSAFNASSGAFTPEAFMAAVVEGADADPDNAPARYDAKGNIFVGTDEAIWIYS